MNSHLYEKVVDSISDALITVDQDKKIVNWNRRAEAIFGYTMEEMQQQGLEVIIPPDYRSRHDAGYEHFTSSIGAHSSYVSEVKELEGIRKSGEVFPIEITHSLLKISDDRYYITAIIRDITARKRYEFMRERLERVMRHDLKNKVIIIGLAAKRLASALTPKACGNVLRYLDILECECKEMLTLLDSTRELILLETGEYKRHDEPVDLMDLLTAKAEQMRTLAASRDVGIELRNLSGWGVVNVLADRSLLERALENLIKNAIEAEEPFGKVSITLLETGDGKMCVEIHNGGKPIPEEIRANIFQPYVTHGKKDGTGLGLYSAKLALEKVHGWKISFESILERGTTFRIELGRSE
jgi:PAS domain S-box-containing protein